MIYRFVACHVLGSFALLLLLATALSNQMVRYGPRRREAIPFWPALISELLNWPAVAVLMTSLFVATVILLWQGIVEYVSKQTVHMHWSRLIAGTFTLFSLLQTAVFAVLMKVISIWQHGRARPFKGLAAAPEHLIKRHSAPTNGVHLTMRRRKLRVQRADRRAWLRVSVCGLSFAASLRRSQALLEWHEDWTVGYELFGLPDRSNRGGPHCQLLFQTILFDDQTIATGTPAAIASSSTNLFQLSRNSLRNWLTPLQIRNIRAT